MSSISSLQDMGKVGQLGTVVYSILRHNMFPIEKQLSMQVEVLPDLDLQFFLPTDIDRYYNTLKLLSNNNTHDIKSSQMNQ